MTNFFRLNLKARSKLSGTCDVKVLMAGSLFTWKRPW